MAVTHTFAIGREQCFQQIDKLIKSHSLHTSESLCKLLRYLAEHSLDHPGIALKEYQIATEVLGRPAGFDPQSDSTVRVQAGRLRVKLAEYYSHDGADDPIVVEIPKGSYALTFQLRPSKPGVPTAPLVLEPDVKKADVTRSESRLAGRRGRSFGSSRRDFVDDRSSCCRSAPAPRPPPARLFLLPYQIFWNRFLTGPQQPWVIFSNGSFVGRPETGMRYFNPASDTRGLHS